MLMYLDSAPRTPHVLPPSVLLKRRGAPQSTAYMMDEFDVASAIFRNSVGTSSCCHDVPPSSLLRSEWTLSKYNVDGSARSITRSRISLPAMASVKTGCHVIPA